MRLCLIVLWVVLLFPVDVVAAQNGVTSLQQLLEQVKQQRVTEQQRLQQRELRFLQAQKQQQALLDQARADKLKQLKSLAPLQAELDRGQQQIDQLTQQLQEKSKNLSSLQGTFSRVAGELAASLNQSLTATEFPDRSSELQRLSAVEGLPTISDLESLWLLMQEEMTASAGVKHYPGQFVDSSGAVINEQLTRVGPFTVFNNKGFLRYLPESKELIFPSRQPSSEYLRVAQNVVHSRGEQSRLRDVIIDPTRGALINQLSHSPSVRERVEQAGLIGLIILALGGVGGVVALWRMVWLGWTALKVAGQLKRIEAPMESNPLGRVLIKAARYSTVNDENYQFKLDEAVLAELPALERGHNFIKLLAAVAPLLGLLGTVTGMILTFQSISLFGNGDPKLMAGGISQALMTTVLGLVVAIPLLFGHSFVVSLSRTVVQRLDEQSAGLLARRLERSREGETNDA